MKKNKGNINTDIMDIDVDNTNMTKMIVMQLKCYYDENLSFSLHVFNFILFISFLVLSCSRI